MIAIETTRSRRPAAWLGSIGQQLERFTSPTGCPFAVLLVELRDLDGCAGTSRRRAWRPTESLERGAHRRAASRGTVADVERPGRYWLLAPGADRAERRVLAERLTRAVVLARRRRRRGAAGDRLGPRPPADGRQAAAAGRARGRRTLRGARQRRALSGPASAERRSAGRGAAGEGRGGAPSGDAEGGRVGGALPTTRVPIRTVSVTPSAAAAPAVRSQSAPMWL